MVASHASCDSLLICDITSSPRHWGGYRLVLFAAWWWHDEDGFLGNISFPLQNKFNILRKGIRINCVVFSNRRDFANIQAISDAWCPEINLWVGSYPFLLRPAFEEFVNMKILR